MPTKNFIYYTNKTSNEILTWLTVLTSLEKEKEKKKVRKKWRKQNCKILST